MPWLNTSIKWLVVVMLLILIEIFGAIEWLLLPSLSLCPSFLLVLRVLCHCHSCQEGRKGRKNGQSLSINQYDLLNLGLLVTDCCTGAKHTHAWSQLSVETLICLVIHTRIVKCPWNTWKHAHTKSLYKFLLCTFCWVAFFSLLWRVTSYWCIHFLLCG